ncbi:tetratricopeptide repeat protein [Sesbania bispinosa]|nr:tetratricopeptide repeat protein [Sesbania bispinosa]
MAMEKNMDDRSILKKKGVITSILNFLLCNQLTEETTTFLEPSHSCEHFNLNPLYSFYTHLFSSLNLM